MNMLAIALALGRGGRQAPKRWPIAKIAQLILGMICLVLLGGCSASPEVAPRVINLQQQWELEPGDEVAGHLVTGSLGDISIELGGQKLYAPFAGKIEQATQPHCVIYSTPEVPAYLFRFCGLKRSPIGKIRAGQSLGSGQYLQFATMRRQPDGTWIIVEPSTGILERAIAPSDHQAAGQP
ncbi:MAG: hypothetical protein AAF152_08035 [Cyanobacteria bacterium P01_A01_bin.114]